MTRPIRIQRKRVRGWKMPDNTVYVGRPTKWGNPFYVGKPNPIRGIYFACNEAEDAVRLYKYHVTFLDGLLRYLRDDLDQLRGKNIACFCALDQPCHADVLLEIANQERE